MVTLRKKLGQYLIRWGVIDETQLNEALKIGKGAGKRVGQVLIELGYATEENLAKALASQFNLEHINIDDVQEQISVAMADKAIPEEIVKKFLVLPLGKDNYGRTRLIVHDPMDLELMDLLRFRLNTEVETVIASRSTIKEYIDKALSDTASALDTAIKGLGGDEEEDDSGLALVDSQDDGSGGDVKASDAPIIRLTKKLIGEAVQERASDIHIEPMADRVRVRYRVDGVCHERDNIPKRMQAPMITRIKILSGMKVDERRIPQDGRIKMKFGDKRIDFRVSSCPAYHGESVVLRILRPDSVRIGMSGLGIEADNLEKFNKAIKRPNGIFLVTGPTGSGKTTTLYSALDTLNRPDRKIITAEDPVEYNFSGINQCQVRADIGLTFPAILKSMLRQAPNIILVGEIRDKEVADIAIQASLTGHLVFSTLHTNDAPSAITRLIDMGVKPFLVASSIQAVMGQRLIRSICQDCREPDTSPSKFHLKLCGIDPAELVGQTIYKAVGCASCGNTGYRGRRGIHEYMTMNSELRELAFKRAPATQVRRAAVLAGMRTLVGDGKMKILAGLTTPEEIARVAQVDTIVTAEDLE